MLQCELIDGCSLLLRTVLCLRLHTADRIVKAELRGYEYLDYSTSTRTRMGTFLYRMLYYLVLCFTRTINKIE